MFSHRAVVYMSFFCFFNSITTSTTDSINAEKSAIGPASNTPIIPKRSGSSRVNGINKKVCLVNANRAPFNDFPIAVKKTGRKQLHTIYQHHEKIGTHEQNSKFKIQLVPISE